MGDQGPEPVLTEVLPFIDESETDVLFNEVLLKIGFYYSPALGQGDAPSVGLFGPLPIPKVDDYLGIAHSFFIKDPSNKDPRMRGNSYSFIVFFVPKTLIRLFTNREEMSRIIEGSLSEIEQIDEINLDFLKRLKREMFSL